MGSFFKQIYAEARCMFFNSSIFMIFALAPIFYGLFYAYPYKNEVPKKIPIAIVDQDHTAISRNLSAMLNDSESLDIVAYPGSFDEAEQMFYQRKIYSIVIIPDGFAEDLLSGSQSIISVYSDGGYVMYYKESFAGVQIAAATFGAGVTINKLAGAGIAVPIAYKSRTSVSLNNYPLYNPSGGYATYVLPAVFILIIHQLMIIAICMTMGEQRLRKPFSMVSASTVLFAKIILNFIIMSFQALFLFFIVLPLFNIPFDGAYFDLFIFLLPFFLTVILLGIFLGSFVNVPETVILYVAVTSMPLLFISGVSWAKYSMPVFIRVASEIFPSSHGINGFVRIYREGANLQEVWSDFFILCFMTFVLFIVSFMRLRVVLKKS